MWRQKNSTVFAVLLIAITLNFIVTPTYAKNTELEGENYAPSSSSFQKPANVHTKNDTVTVGYFLGGGIQNSFNKESYPAFSGTSRCIRHTGVDSGSSDGTPMPRFTNR